MPQLVGVTSLGFFEGSKLAPSGASTLIEVEARMVPGFSERDLLQNRKRDGQAMRDDIKFTMALKEEMARREFSAWMLPVEGRLEVSAFFNSGCRSLNY